MTVSITDPGLCATCRHARLIATERGSTFWRCSRSDADPRFPRYPRLPVTACLGYEPGGSSDHPSTSRTGP